MDIACWLAVSVSEIAAVFRIRSISRDIEPAQSLAVEPCSMAFLVEKEYRGILKIPVKTFSGRQSGAGPSEVVPCSSHDPAVAAVVSVLCIQQCCGFLLAVRIPQHAVFFHESARKGMHMEIVESRHYEVIFKVEHFGIPVDMLRGFVCRARKDYP